MTERHLTPLEQSVFEAALRRAQERHLPDLTGDELDRLNHLARQELAAERNAKRDRIGRIQFVSAGAKRER